MRTTRLLASVAAMFLLAGGLAGCGSNDKPAICSSVDTLKESVQNLKDVQIGAGTLATVQSDVSTIKKDLTQVKADAKSQYGAQVNKVQASASTLSTSVQAAKAGPSITTFAAIGTSASTLAADVKTLADDVSSTC
jgi:hypothetical protein